MILIKTQSLLSRLALLTVLALSTLSLSSYAADASQWKDPIITITAGSSITEFNAEVRADSKQFDSIGTTIDFEDDLGFDDSNTFDRFQIRWDINRRHNISLTYLPMDRSASVRLDEDIQYDDIIIEGNARVDSKAEIDIYDLEYTYNFIAREKHRLGATLGIHTIRWNLELTAYGEVTFLQNKNTQQFSDGYEVEDSLDAPLPLIGFSYAYMPTKRWRLSAAARVLDLTIDEYHGAMFLTNFAAEYYLTRNIGIGTAITAFDIEVDADKDSFEGELQWAYSGLNAYLIARF